MDLQTIRSFGGELEKLAISAGTTLSLLQQRAAQGARVAPALMQRAEAAAAQGLTHTPAAARRAALGAGESVRAMRGAEGLAASAGTDAARAALQSRAQQMTQAIESAPRSVTSPIVGGHMSRGYSPAAADFMAGRGSLAQAQAHTLANPTIHQAQRAVPQGRSPSMMHATPPMGASAVGNTNVVNAAALDKTQVGLVGGRSTGDWNQGTPYVPLRPTEGAGTAIAKRRAA